MSMSCPAAAAAVLPAHFFDVNMDGEAREEGDIYAVAMGNKFGLFESADNWGASKPDVRFKLIKYGKVYGLSLAEARATALEWLVAQDLPARKRAAVEAIVTREAEAAARAARAEAARLEATMREEARREAALLAECRAVLEMVINRVEWRLRPPHQRSAAKKKERAQKRVAVRRWRAASSTASTATTIEAGATAPADDQVRLRERDLERQLKTQRQLVKSERKRRCRDSRVLLARAKQAERRAGKAIARKRSVKQTRGETGAARRDRARKRKGRAPDKDELHAGERKHRRLLAAHSSRRTGQLLGRHG